jgi:hypothetical protein
MARVKSYWRTRMLLLGVGVAAALPIAGIAYASIPDSNGSSTAATWTQVEAHSG